MFDTEEIEEWVAGLNPKIRFLRPKQPFHRQCGVVISGFGSVQKTIAKLRYIVQGNRATEPNAEDTGPGGWEVIEPPQVGALLMRRRLEAADSLEDVQTRVGFAQRIS